MSNLEQGIAIFQAGDYSQAFKILKPIAEQGNAEAQCIIGNMYDLGLCVEPNPREAIYWYLQAAQQGHMIPQNNLGNIYFIEGNLEEAEKWLLKSAQQGFPIAIVTLANLYSTKATTSINQTEIAANQLKAAKGYQIAAENNFPFACHRLGDIYASGLGLEKDEQEAVKWYQKAAEQNFQPSQEVLAQAYLEGLLGLPKDSQQAEYWQKKATPK